LTAANEELKSAGSNGDLCPFLGLKGDSGTALAFPSYQNCCYHAKPVDVVSIEHQRKHCLSKQFVECPVYQKEENGRLPKDLRSRHPDEQKIKTWIPIMALIVVVVVGLVAYIVFGFFKIPGMQGVPLGGTPTSTPTTATVIVSTATRTPIAVVKITVTKTLSTPTVAFFSLETPISGNPQLVLHRVLSGESFNYLAQKNNTTVQAIKAINFDLQDALTIDKVLVIPINIIDVTGIPAFSCYEVEADGMTVEEVANLKQVEEALILKYNLLPDGHLLSKGEWLLIPH
jgi:LysM repeat protein